MTNIHDLKIPERYQKDIEIAVSILKEEGCEAIYLFGSLVTGNIHENSDIDIGVRGVPEGKFLHIHGVLDGEISNKYDIVVFDRNEEMFSILDQFGEVVEIG